MQIIPLPKLHNISEEISQQIFIRTQVLLQRNIMQVFKETSWLFWIYEGLCFLLKNSESKSHLTTDLVNMKCKHIGKVVVGSGLLMRVTVVYRLITGGAGGLITAWCSGLVAPLTSDHSDRSGQWTCRYKHTDSNASALILIRTVSCVTTIQQVGLPMQHFLQLHQNQFI